MERPVSRRRHRTVKQEDEVDASTDTSMSTTGKPVVKDVESRTRSIWGYIAALIVVICAAYTLLARGAQTPLLQTSSHHGDSSIDIDEPTRLQDLHPEDHIYRPPTTIKLNLTVSFGMRRPDGVVKKVYLINDQLEKPARTDGDDFLGHNDMDGVDSVTQCPITPGGSFLYNFTIAGYQSGTFWYHSHSSLQRGEGLFGALTIHKPVPLSIRGSTPSRALQSESERFGYDKEALMLMGDWYHDPAHKTMDWYLSAASWGNEVRLETNKYEATGF
ncbi:hypothetical protein KEM56_000864 [Ascosphaera pollenicola]|nr:hypothetical protein KEM56_000864 [Ascosphaera pollenicola]